MLFEQDEFCRPIEAADQGLGVRLEIEQYFAPLDTDFFAPIRHEGGIAMLLRELEVMTLYLDCGSPLAISA